MSKIPASGKPRTQNRQSNSTGIAIARKRNRSVFAESLVGFQKNDVAIARTAIGLAELTAAETRIASVLLKHFNTQTGQCNPSLERLAELSNVALKTVTRALDSLDRSHRMFAKRDIGGKYDCKFYIPNWSTFRTIAADWDEKMKGYRKKFVSDTVETKMSTLQGQKCPSDTGKNVHLTHPNNPFKKTLMGKLEPNEAGQPQSTDGVVIHLSTAKPPASATPEHWRARPFGAKVPPFGTAEVSKKAAEARLQAFVAERVQTLGEGAWNMETTDWDEALEAELKSRGAGSAHLDVIWAGRRLRHKST